MEDDSTGVRYPPWVLWVALLAGCLTPDEGPQPTETPSDASAGLPDPLATLSWKNHAGAPTPRTEAVVANLGAKFYAIGGYAAGNNAVQTVEIYDADQDAWTTGPDYPIPIHHTIAVAHDGAIYAFGGYTTNSFVPTALAFKLDPSSAAWTALESLPTARGAHAGALVNGKIYLAGGVGLSGLQKAVHVYDPSSNQWATAPDLPTPRDHLGAAALEGQFHVVGGRAQSISSNTPILESYDPATQKWTKRADMPTARGGITATAYRDHVVVVGGERSQATFAEVEAWNPGANQWRSLAELPTPRHGLGSGVWNDRLYALLGGPEQSFTLSNVVESLGP